MKKTQEFIKKYFTYITFGLAIVFFLLGGLSLFFTKQEGISKTTSHKVAGAVSVLAPSTTPTPTPVSTQTNNQIIPTATATPVQAPQTNSPTPTSNPTASLGSSTQQTVNMQIAEPDGTNNFSLPVGGNACNELTEAKNEGKIRSVTFSDQYMSSMHSLYVTEINGYQNNWTFTVNGQGPAGCSLASPKAGDTVIWKFS